MRLWDLLNYYIVLFELKTLRFGRSWITGKTVSRKCSKPLSLEIDISGLHSVDASSSGANLPRFRLIQ